jgi:hypothetical protein
MRMRRQKKVFIGIKIVRRIVWHKFEVKNTTQSTRASNRGFWWNGANQKQHNDIGPIQIKSHCVRTPNMRTVDGIKIVLMWNLEPEMRKMATTCAMAIFVRGLGIAEEEENGMMIT